MTDTHENASDEADDFGIGDVVRLRESHRHFEAGTRGRIIGFYATESREALLALDDGGELRVPYPNLERAP